MESKEFGVCVEKFSLKWQRSEPDTTVMSSTGWEGMGRGQRRNLLGGVGDWKDQGEVLCSFSGVPLGICWQILSQPSLPFSVMLPNLRSLDKGTGS